MTDTATGTSSGVQTVTMVIAGGTESERRELVQALGSDQLPVLAQAADVAEALEALRECTPDVCIIAGKLRGGRLGGIARLAAASPETKIAVVLDAASEDRHLQSVRAGAHGYLDPSLRSDRLAQAVRALAAGEALIPRELSGNVVSELRRGVIVAPERRRSRIAYVLLYPPRFWRHLWRRLRSHMSLGMAWSSARHRMQHYR